jgi:hypothetical protein
VLDIVVTQMRCFVASISLPMLCSPPEDSQGYAPLQWPAVIGSVCLDIHHIMVEQLQNPSPWWSSKNGQPANGMASGLG